MMRMRQEQKLQICISKHKEQDEYQEHEYFLQYAASQCPYFLYSIEH